MIKSELNMRSPLRIFEKSTNGGVGKGNIGVITAQKGVGKTACLVHIATDQLFQDKHVIHVSFSAQTGHIITWYENIFRQITNRFNLDSAMDVHDEIIKNRIIMNFNQDGVRMSQITKSIQSMIENGNFLADIIIIDGYDFKKGTLDDILEIRRLASKLDLEVWISASLQDDQHSFDNHGIPAVLSEFINEISILIYLKPDESCIHLELVKDHDEYPLSDMHLKLDSETLLILEVYE